MATYEEAMQALRAADAAGDVPAARRLAEIAHSLRPTQTITTSKSVPDSAPPVEPSKPRTLLDTVKGALVGIGSVGIEAPLAIGTGMVGQVAGAGTALANKAFGATDADAARRGVAVRDAMTYQPKNEAGQAVVEGLGHAMDASGIAGVPIPTLNQLGQAGSLARPLARPYADAVAMPVVDKAIDAVASAKARLRPADDMVGVGAAATPMAAQRIAMAQELPVPIRLTKGQATRTLEDQRFERETAKDAERGEPLRQTFAGQSKAIEQNFDNWYDQTGAQAPSVRFTGELVHDTILAKYKDAAKKVGEAYEKAEASGAMNEPIDITPLREFLSGKEAEKLSAGILESIQSKTDKLAQSSVKDAFGKPDMNKMTISDLEAVRRAAGELAGKDATAALYGKQIKKLIDSMTEGHGGEEYKAARKLRFQKGQEFERTWVVKKLLDTKPGTNDRAVAFEDIFKHSILDGSLDDVRKMRKTLHTAGPQGKQAWKELQGETLRYIKEEITKGATTDVNGNKLIRPQRLNDIITSLDHDGKLEFVFGKQGAQKLRNINSIAADILTSPPGAVNTSGTASVLTGMMDGVIMSQLGLPVPVVTGSRYAIKLAKDRAIKKRIDQHINYGEEPQP